MTGSGKTGLCLGLLEEAAIDGIPAIAIDPKGDIGNLLLSFPGLQPADFRPWVDEAEAARKGMSGDDYAAATAATWRKGLSDWGQDAERIARLRAAVDLAIYTPGNTAGRPLQVLRSLAAPPPELRADTTAMRERIMSAASGLLGLLGLAADPVQSREHILLSNLLDRAWREGRNLDLSALIGEIQKPPFDKVGVFDLETFYPARERLGLAMGLNNLLASPGFSAWMEGEPLDIQRLLYTPAGKPRVSILSIAHLSDAERMFFVTILLNELLAWTRAQSGTSSLRALLYMDEIYGYFPPTAMPPAKAPMLTLLKQARAYGLGVVLATQNPVDLDYKGLANTGTWFIGRLQTERDKARVIEGLEGVLAGSGGAFDRSAMEAQLAGLGNRVFLMRNVHEDQPVLFQTRWTLSYLRGPLTLPQIQRLNAATLSPPSSSSFSSSFSSSPSIPPPPPAAFAPPPAPAPAARPVLPPDVTEVFLRARAGDVTLYKPMAAGVSRLHFVDAKAGVDYWQTLTHLAPLSDDGRSATWEEASVYGDIKNDLDRQPAAGAAFAAPPAGATRAASVKGWQAALEDFLYQTRTLDLMQCAAVKLASNPGESEGDFKVRVAQALRERRDVEVEKVRRKYAPKLQTLTDQIRRAEERVAREKSQVTSQTMNTVISVGATLLGAFLGRKVVSATNVGRAATSMKSASRIGREKEDVARAAENQEVLQQRLADLNAQVEQEAAALQSQFEPEAATIETSSLHPRKSDITVAAIGLAWIPWRSSAGGGSEPAYP